jgi:hypothetical protein
MSIPVSASSWIIDLQFISIIGNILWIRMRNGMMTVNDTFGSTRNGMAVACFKTLLSQHLTGGKVKQSL